MLFPNARIMVFAKAPVTGRCKTRLIPSLGKHGAAELHAKLVRRTLDITTNAHLCPVELWCADNIDHPFIIECKKQYPIVVRQQRGHDLGERMLQAFQQTLNTAPFALLIGTDCPTLDKQDLRDALSALNEGTDGTLHPAHDGGYVSIGLRKVDNRLFSNMSWGMANVYQETCLRLEHLNWSWKALAFHHDIDRPEDLQHLPSTL